MSELLKKENKKVLKLKELIIRLHNGEDPTLVKKEFIDEFQYVSGAEIAQMEMQLVEDGMSIDEIMNLCDIHASLFDGNITEVHSDIVENHPFDIFREENKEIEELINETILPVISQESITVSQLKNQLLIEFPLLDMLDAHYNKKEQLLFPLLEQANVTTIPQVMWGVDNEIRSELKQAKEDLVRNQEVSEKWLTDFKATINKALDMVTKENNILFNILEEHLTTAMWDDLRKNLNEEAVATNTMPPELKEGVVELPSGKFQIEELEAILNVIPLDVTFVYVTLHKVFML